MELELSVHIKKKKKLYSNANKSIKNLNVKGKTIGLIILVTKRLLKQDTICISLKGKALFHKKLLYLECIKNSFCLEYHHLQP